MDKRWKEDGLEMGSCGMRDGQEMEGRWMEDGQKRDGRGTRDGIDAYSMICGRVVNSNVVNGRIDKVSNIARVF